MAKTVVRIAQGMDKQIAHMESGLIAQVLIAHNVQKGPVQSVHSAQKGRRDLVPTVGRITVQKGLE
jgi:hypothetical protein